MVPAFPPGRLEYGFLFSLSINYFVLNDFPCKTANEKKTFSVVSDC